MNKILLLTLSLFCASQFSKEAKAQTISQKGDTLISVHAKSYQWLRNGQAINGETNQKLVLKESGNYSVRLGDKSLDFKFINKYTTLTGVVYNEKLEPISNVNLTVNGISTRTDEKGHYIVKFPMTERAIVRAEHSQFKSKTFGFLPTDAETLFKDFGLESFQTTHSFDSQKTILIGTNGFAMNMPDSSMINVKTGQAYYGKVNAQISAHQPGDAMFGEQMPGGDFLGITKEGRENVLYSFGFFSCELKGENGEDLNLQKGKTATVNFEVPENQRSRMQSTVPLWHFDENIGAWVEVGVTKKLGNSYTGEVSHFSAWNVDWKGERAWVEGEVLACNGTNTSGGTVYAEQVPVQVDSKGFYRGWIPAQWDIDMYNSAMSKEHSVPKLVAEATYTVPKITINRLKGVGYIDTEGLLKMYQLGNEGKVTYSADGGKTFQASNIFQFKKGDNSPKKCVVKDEKDCENHFTAKTIRAFVQECELLETETIVSSEWLNIANYLQRLQSGKPEYTLTITQESDLMTVLDNQSSIGCLQGIKINNVKDATESLIWGCVLTAPLLQWIEISGGKLTDISSLMAFKYLSYLDLSSDELTTLSKDVENFKNLQTLNLSGNKLTSLPSEISEWRKLEFLNLSGNQLTALSKEIGEWKSLQFLELNENRLTNLPKEISNWKNLETLNSTSNQLISIPKEIGDCSKLISINLYNNQLTSLPPEIAKLKDNLKSLVLMGNNFSQEEKDKVKNWLPKTSITW